MNKLSLLCLLSLITSGFSYAMESQVPVYERFEHMKALKKAIEALEGSAEALDAATYAWFKHRYKKAEAKVSKKAGKPKKDKPVVKEKKVGIRKTLTLQDRIFGTFSVFERLTQQAGYWPEIVRILQRTGSDAQHVAWAQARIERTQTRLQAVQEEIQSLNVSPDQIKNELEALQAQVEKEIRESTNEEQLVILKNKLARISRILNGSLLAGHNLLQRPPTVPTQGVNVGAILMAAFLFELGRTLRTSHQ